MAKSRKVHVPALVSRRISQIETEQERRRSDPESRFPPEIINVLRNIGVSREEAEKDGIKYTVNEADKNALTKLLNMEGFRWGAQISVEYHRARMKSGKIIYHNGCAFELQSGREVWYGDIDVSAGLKKLENIAGIFGNPFAITVETPYRWQERLDLSRPRAMRVFSGEKSVLIPDPFYLEHPGLAATFSKSYTKFPHVVFIMPGAATEEEMKAFAGKMLIKFGSSPEKTAET